MNNMVLMILIFPGKSCMVFGCLITAKNLGTTFQSLLAVVCKGRKTSPNASKTFAGLFFISFV